MPTYRQFYWQKTKEQLALCWQLFWNGVVMDKGHHVDWQRKGRSRRKLWGRK